MAECYKFGQNQGLAKPKPSYLNTVSTGTKHKAIEQTTFYTWGIFWLKDDSLEDTENLPPPEVLAAEIVEQLEAALEEFRGVEEALMPEVTG
jgi:hypothetical protein